jgi:ATP-dependent RNA helicase DDX56/DBP9
MGKKQRRSRQQEEQVETPAPPHEDAPAAAAAAEEAAAQEVAVEGQTQTQGATNGGVKEEGKGEAAAEEEVKDVSFDELGLDEQLKRALRKKGLTNTTLIQREAIPRILVRDFWLPLLAFASPVLVLCANSVELFDFKFLTIKVGSEARFGTVLVNERSISLYHQSGLVTENSQKRF